MKEQARFAEAPGEVGFGVGGGRRRVLVSVDKEGRIVLLGAGNPVLGRLFFKPCVALAIDAHDLVFLPNTSRRRQGVGRARPVVTEEAEADRHGESGSCEGGIAMQET